MTDEQFQRAVTLVEAGHWEAVAFLAVGVSPRFAQFAMTDAERDRLDQARDVAMQGIHLHP